MKNMRKILSLVLAFVMVLSLSVTAFATTTAAPCVNVTVVNSRSGKTDSWTLSATAGQSVKSVLDADSLHTISWNNEVKDYYNPETLHSALTSYNGYGATGFDPTNEADQAYLNKTDYDYREITWCSGAYQGYGLVDYDEVTKEYTYIYAGYDWTYKNDAGDIWDYMCCHFLDKDEVIYLEYKFTVTDEWTTTNPIG